MAGKLPIDRARDRKDAARPYEDNKQAFAENQVTQTKPDQPQPDASVRDKHQSGQERDDA